MSTPAKFFCSGKLRGPFDRMVAYTAVSIMSSARTSGNSQASVAAQLDVVRDVYADDPKFVTAVVQAVLYFGEERGLLG